MKKDNIHLLGKNIKARRKQLQMTLQTLSEYTSLSVGFLSNVERNLTSPTIENLHTICEALNTTISDLLDADKNERFLIRKKDTRIVEHPQYNQVITYIDFGFIDQLFEIITINPGEIENYQESRHVYDENCTVLSGTLTVRLDGKDYVLTEGDSIFIKRNTLHLIYNETDTPCSSYWVYHRNSW